MPADSSTGDRVHNAADRQAAPPEGVFLASAAIAPITAGAIVAFLVPHAWRAHIIHATIVWSGAVLSFLAGVRRGDSFHTIDGPTVLQLTTIFAVFACGLVSLLLPWPTVAIAALIAGCACVGLLDPIGARRRLAPRFLARLRPPQMLLAVISLGFLLIAALR